MPADDGNGLDALFAPRSIAVVGASSRPSAFSRRAMGYLQQYGFDGVVSAVNPVLDRVVGSVCYPTISAVPGGVDLALVFVAAARVIETLRDAAKAGVRSAVIFSSGFAELGAAGRAMQDEVRSVAREAGIRLVGPNCQGIIHAANRVVATFTNAAVGLADALVGPIAYIGQSGAVGGSLFDQMRARGVVPAVWASTGNQVDVTVTEVARYLVDDPAVDTLLLYLEQTPPGRDWSALCDAAQRAGKQIIALHAGRTEAGRRAAALHTGALVGEQRSFQLLCESYGVLLVDDLRPMIDRALARRGGMHRAGRRLGVVTTSGGAGGLVADGCAGHGLDVPMVSATTQGRLAAMLPGFASSANPVDVTAQFVLESVERTGELCQVLASDPAIDQVLIVATNLAGDVATSCAASVIEALPRIGAPQRAPVGVVFLAAAERTVEARRLLAGASVATFEMVGDALAAIGALAQPGGEDATGGPGGDRSRPVSHPLGEPGVRVVTEAEGAAVLDRAGVPRPASVLARSPQEARRAAAELGGSVVLKVQSAEVLHKTDAGGVRVGVGTDDAEASYRAIMASVAASVPGAVVDGVLVQRQVPAGVELLVGVQAGRDGYAPVLSVAIGGIGVEIYADVVSALAPVDAPAAKAMLRSLRGWPLLHGFRGRPPVDVSAAAEAIAAIGEMAVAYGDALVEVEINPLIVHEHGAHAADFVARLREQ